MLRLALTNLKMSRKNFDRVSSKINGVIINKAKIKASSYSSYYTNDKYYTDHHLVKDEKEDDSEEV